MQKGGTSLFWGTFPAKNIHKEEKNAYEKSA